MPAKGFGKTSNSTQTGTTTTESVPSTTEPLLDDGLTEEERRVFTQPTPQATSDRSPVPPAAQSYADADLRFQGSNEEFIEGLVRTQQQTTEGQRQLRKLNNMLKELKTLKEDKTDRNHLYALAYGLVEPVGAIEVALREQAREALGLNQEAMPDFIEIVDGQLIVHEDRMLTSTTELETLSQDVTAQLLQLLEASSQNDRKVPLLRYEAPKQLPAQPQ
jgi:hypothetical protein